MSQQLSSHDKSLIRKILIQKEIYLKDTQTGSVIEYPLDEDTLFVLNSQLTAGILDEKLLAIPDGYVICLSPTFSERYWANSKQSLSITALLAGIIIYSIFKKTK